MSITEYHAAFSAMFCRSDVTAANLHALRKRKGWKTGRTGQFERGHESPNKGKPCQPGQGGRHPNARKTQFRKGTLPHNHRGAGHERIDLKDGYVILIVAETNPWTGAATRPVLKHKWLWEQQNGPVPEGHALKCLDGNKQNTDPSNWTPITRGELAALNSRSRVRKVDDGQRSGKLRHRWSEADMATLRRLAPTSRAAEIAAELGISTDAVYAQACREQVSIRGQVRWTPERVALLRSLAGTAPPDELAARFETTPAALEQAAKRNRISLASVSTSKGGRALFWTNQRIRALRELAEVKRCSAEICARELGVSRNAVIGAAKRHGVNLPGNTALTTATAPRAPKAKPVAPQRPARMAAPVRAVANTARKNPRATTITPTISASKWMRLRHPDGRWLRMDGLGWTQEKANSFIARGDRLKAILKRFELARECQVVSDTGQGRDLAGYTRIAAECR